MNQTTENVRKSYDLVADEYTAHIADELEYKPLDRDLLRRFVRQTRRSGQVCDLGCGPGHVTSYLYEQGASVLGIDLSARMVELARQHHPDIEFQQGNMAALTDIQDESWAGIVAFYSLIHFERPQLVAVLQEFYRVLQPNGLLLLAFHEGQEVRHFDEWWNQPVSLNFNFFERTEIEHYLNTAGFTIEESLTRSPYDSVEVQTQRSYIIARKP
ncbi:methyltransferase [Dictyobacter vulcani]|uniref:Methyltransferase n=1 Tax=Dictyobacter vulcani TaxID=2607529 RepID=A0A5J4KZK2_9CHLR|nr:class I SAM-dependent methyltransferase [Dictyobacter vulcani]GER91901.1 methyltransferase [Dictyobacter vulcani]